MWIGAQLALKREDGILTMTMRAMLENVKV